MAESSRDNQERCSKDQLAERDTSAVAPLVGGEEASNNDEDPSSGMAVKGGEHEDDQEISENLEQDQMDKEKVSFELCS